MRSVGLAPCARVARVAIMFEFLKQPISLKRAPSKAPSAPDETPVAAPSEASGAPTAAPSAPRAQRPRNFLKQPISLKRSPSRASNAQAAAPSEASTATASSAPADAPRRRRSAPRPRGTRSLVGLEIEPGQLIAVQSRLNGHVVVERAAGTPIAANLVRDGEVTDVDALSAALAELFEGSGLDRRVRIGIANQRIVMRQIELPPITDPKELHNAVQFQAQDEIPMPIDSVVLDYHVLGIQDTPDGPRMQVLL